MAQPRDQKHLNGTAEGPKHT